ncbi:MAG: hypothetical protein JSR63_11860 [Proteobacteria bacterium]|nr:hypothetical protein [Pseudomonadota bacterium]MBS0218854.1 hypothetical protein [Pseudomonadota bacterium]
MQTSTTFPFGLRERHLWLALGVFAGWRLLRGFKSLFWTAFGIAWIVYWTHGGHFW